MPRSRGMPGSWRGFRRPRTGCASAALTCEEGNAGTSGGSACVMNPVTGSRCWSTGAPRRRVRSTWPLRARRMACGDAGTSPCAAAAVTGVDDEVLEREGVRGYPWAGRGGRAAGRARGHANRQDARHRRHVAGRAGRDHPVGALRRAGGPGRSRHREDRRRPAPRGLPALHAPSPRRSRCAGGGAQARCSSATSARCCPASGRRTYCCAPSGSCSPGSAADRAEGRLAEELKGRAMMADVLAAAVRDRQHTGPAEIEFAGETLQLDRQVVAEATRRARPPGSRTTGPGRSSRNRSSLRSPTSTPESPANSPGSFRPTSLTSSPRRSRRSRPTSRPSRRSPAAATTSSFNSLTYGASCGPTRMYVSSSMTCGLPSRRSACWKSCSPARRGSPPRHLA